MMEENKLSIDASLLIMYAYGMLNPEISVQVKLALEKNETLRWEYEGIIKLIKDFPDHDPEELLDEMSAGILEKAGMNKAVPQKKSKIIPLSRKPLALAACLAAAMFIALVVKWNINKNDPMLFAQNEIRQYNEHPDASRGDAISNSYAWTSGYINGKYDEVIKSIEAKNGLDETEVFFLGISYLKSVNPDPAKAERFFKIAVNGSELQSDAYLFLGIAQLLQKKNSEAEGSLSKSHHPHAAVLLDLIRK